MFKAYNVEICNSNYSCDRDVGNLFWPCTFAPITFNIVI